jgi:hypothetical protein
VDLVVLRHHISGIEAKGVDCGQGSSFGYDKLGAKSQINGAAANLQARIEKRLYDETFFVILTRHELHDLLRCC